MTTVRLICAAASLASKLLKLAERGDQVIIMRDGTPVAELARYRARRSGKIQLGWAAGQATAEARWEKAMTENEAEAFFGGKL